MAKGMRQAFGACNPRNSRADKSGNARAMVAASRMRCRNCQRQSCHCAAVAAGNNRRRMPCSDGEICMCADIAKIAALGKLPAVKPKALFDQTTALEVVPGTTPDDTTRLDLNPTPADPDPSILKDLAPAAPSPTGIGSRQLTANYRSILAARAVYHPVAYRFPRELGRGRQGIVFLGLRQGARGCVTRHAIKLFDPAIYSTAKKYWTDMGRIAAQTAKLQLVKNPALVAPDIYEESNGIGYVQMEVVDGISLRELLDGDHLEQARARCTEEEWQRFTDVIFRLQDGKLMIQPGIALYILRQVLRGLETLHEMGFVHGDVKPANIMIDRLGYVKLIDYGRASLVDEKMTLLLGTPMYMAPEIHTDRIARTSSDIYSLGLVGLEMLRGQRLFPAICRCRKMNCCWANTTCPRNCTTSCRTMCARTRNFWCCSSASLSPTCPAVLPTRKKRKPAAAASPCSTNNSRWSAKTPIMAANWKIISEKSSIRSGRLEARATVSAAP